MDHRISDNAKMSMGYFGMYKSRWYCRWCGNITGQLKTERDGFCNNNGKCKQAWWRAYKKYKANVTENPGQLSARGTKSNAKRTKKKRK
jgi:hypothetical protein